MVYPGLNHSISTGYNGSTFRSGSRPNASQSSGYGFSPRIQGELGSQPGVSHYRQQLSQPSMMTQPLLNQTHPIPIQPRMPLSMRVQSSPRPNSVQQSLTSYGVGSSYPTLPQQSTIPIASSNYHPSSQFIQRSPFGPGSSIQQMGSKFQIPDSRSLPAAYSIQSQLDHQSSRGNSGVTLASSSQGNTMSRSVDQSRSKPSLSELSGYHQARRRSYDDFTSNLVPREKAEDGIPPTKSSKLQSGGLIKSEALSYEDLKQEALGEPIEKKSFSPTKLPYMETGCGSTLYREVNAFSGTLKEERNPALTAKIDEDFSSCRAPLEVLKDVMTDNDWLESVEDDAKKELINRASQLKELTPSCNCLEPGAPENGPFYTHLGHAKTLIDLRKKFEKLYKVEGVALRIEVVRYTGKEGKTSEDCPIAKWVLRRSGDHEKYLVVVKQRYRHFCDYTWVAASIIQWEGVPVPLADKAYDELAMRTANYGTETDRQCAANKKKTCACQGLDMAFNGASYTFGCSWTMYHNICKFCRSNEVHKFKLTEYSKEGDLEKICEQLTDAVTPVYQKLAPDSFNNMCLFSDIAAECRIGSGKFRPFSGITCVCDFCAHSHKDTNNMVGGATAVVTLLRPEDRLSNQKEDEQFHVLPLYVPDCTASEMESKVASGGLEVLNKFTRTIAIREIKKANCKRGRLPAERKRMLDGLIPKDYTKDDRTFNHPSLRPPGFESMPQLDGLNSSGSSDDGETTLNSTAYSNSSFVNSSMDAADRSLDSILDNMKILTHESDCLEAFDDPTIGGVAFALTHGSILIECAKQELHATTALKKPNRAHPHRIGLVFYQHKNLHYVNHGVDEFQRKRAIREFRDYVQWLKGNYVPTEAKLKAMTESGFVFPNEVKTVNRPMDIANPDDFFRSDAFSGAESAKEIDEKLNTIRAEFGQDLKAFDVGTLSEGPSVEDEINYTPNIGVELTEADLKEVQHYEELLRKEFGPK